MGTISSFKTHISYTFCRQPVYSLYHGYNCSNLMLTKFIGTVSIFLNVTYIEHYNSFKWTVIFFQWINFINIFFFFLYMHLIRVLFQIAFSDSVKCTLSNIKIILSGWYSWILDKLLLEKDYCFPGYVLFCCDLSDLCLDLNLIFQSRTL